MFLIRGGMAPNNVGTENSINHLLPYPGGYLTSTDGGLYRYSPENPHNSFVPEGGYRRSVRQVYSLGEREYFVATQDGLKFYDGDSFSPLGKNTEIDSFVGSLNHEVVGTAELEVFIADQEGVRFIPCPNVIKSVVLSLDSIYVATSSSIGIVIGEPWSHCSKRQWAIWFRFAIAWCFAVMTAFTRSRWMVGHLVRRSTSVDHIRICSFTVVGCWPWGIRD